MVVFMNNRVLNKSRIDLFLFPRTNRILLPGNPQIKLNPIIIKKQKLPHEKLVKQAPQRPDIRAPVRADRLPPVVPQLSSYNVLASL